MPRRISDGSPRRRPLADGVVVYVLTEVATDMPDVGGMLATSLTQVASAVTIPAIAVGVLVVVYALLRACAGRRETNVGLICTGLLIAVAPTAFTMLMSMSGASGGGSDAGGRASPSPTGSPASGATITATPRTAAPDLSEPSHGPQVSTTLITLAIIAGILVAVTITAVIASKAVTRARRSRSERRAAEQFTTTRWTKTLAQHDSVLSEYGEIEMDAARSLLLPALFRSEPGSATEAFLNALERAGSLRTETVPPPMFLNDYVAAVDDLESAWRAAIRYARKAGTSHLSADIQRKVSRAIGLLNQARSSDNAFEQRVFLQAAQKLVNEIDYTGEIAVPPATFRAIEAGLREQLPAGTLGGVGVSANDD